MKKEEFIVLLEEAIDIEELNENMLLNEIDGYDSIAILSLMSIYDEINVKVSPNDFKDLKTINDLIQSAGNEIE